MITCISSQTYLSGRIEGKKFKAAGNPYIVTESVIISGNKPTVFNKGCLLLFKRFTELDVYGTLIVSGEPDSPVVFTSINDQDSITTDTIPAPFDWNGIKIRLGAEGTTLKNFRITYSVYGLQSQTEDIEVVSGRFSDNGQFHFTIKERIEPVTDNLPYTHHRVIYTDTTKVVSSTLTNIVKTGSIVTGALTLGTSGYFLFSSNNANNSYEHADTQEDIDRNRKKRDFSLKITRTTGVLGTVFILVGTGLSIYDKGKKINKKFSVRSEDTKVYITLDF
jgi:hypothetical protein